MSHKSSIPVKCVGNNGTGKMAPEKKAPGRNGTRKKWHCANLENNAPYFFYSV